MLKEIIDKWRLNRNLLADRIGMPKGTFNNKLNETNRSKFTDEELEKLKAVLLELRQDLTEIDDDVFNDALRLIAQKEV